MNVPVMVLTSKTITAPDATGAGVLRWSDLTGDDNREHQKRLWSGYHHRSFLRQAPCRCCMKRHDKKGTTPITHVLEA